MDSLKNITINNLLSKKGKEIFFPKKGILAQASEAKGKKINATIGIALDDNLKPINLSSVAKNIRLAPQEVFPYAPSFGLPELAKTWKKMLLTKNPSLKAQKISLPVVTAGVTNALSTIGYLFINKGDTIILPNLFWGNYKLIFKNAYGAKFVTYNLFLNNKFNIAGLEQKLALSGKKKVVLLNFPNNPTGYTPLKKEAKEIARTLKQAAKAGKQILVLTDDAYFGLVYKKDAEKESIFSKLANLHPNILAVKLDGATKEDYVWGFRVGFITYGTKNASKPFYEFLADKTAGAIRGAISSAPRLSQSLLIAAYKSSSYKKEKGAYFNLLKNRYLKVKEILDKNKEYSNKFKPYPFNSGYFMCVRLLKKNSADTVRKLLLKKYSTGVISFENNLRIAFSSVPEKNLEELFNNIYKACQKI